MSERLKGKHAILTGAAGGIGLTVAAAYLAQGARCTVADLGGQPTPELAALMAHHPDTLVYVPTDVCRMESIDALLVRHRHASDRSPRCSTTPQFLTWLRCCKATRRCTTSCSR